MSICYGVAGYVSSDGIAGGLLVLLVRKQMKTYKNADVAAFKPLNNYFVSDSFKASSVLLFTS